MKNILVLILCLYLSLNAVLLAQSGVNITPDISKSIQTVAENTLKSLQREQPANIRQYLYPGMSIRLLNADELRNLTLDFIDGQITEFEYKLKMSGHNIALFSEKNGRILSNYNILKDIYVGSIIDNEDNRINYYFLKINALYQNVIKNNDSGETLLVPTEVQIEIQLVRVRNEFKIIGFIV